MSNKRVITSYVAVVSALCRSHLRGLILWIQPRQGRRRYPVKNVASEEVEKGSTLTIRRSSLSPFNLIYNSEINHVERERETWTAPKAAMVLLYKFIKVEIYCFNWLMISGLSALVGLFLSIARVSVHNFIIYYLGKLVALAPKEKLVSFMALQSISSSVPAGRSFNHTHNSRTGWGPKAA